MKEKQRYRLVEKGGRNGVYGSPCKRCGRCSRWILFSVRMDNGRVKARACQDG